MIPVLPRPFISVRISLFYAGGGQMSCLSERQATDIVPVLLAGYIDLISAGFDFLLRGMNRREKVLRRLMYLEN